MLFFNGVRYLFDQGGFESLKRFSRRVDFSENDERDAEAAKRGSATTAGETARQSPL